MKKLYKHIFYVLLSLIALFCVAGEISIGEVHAETSDSYAVQEETQGEVSLSGIHFDEKAGYYRLYKDGTIITVKGWHSLSGGDKVYITSAGYIKAKLTKTGSIRKFYNYDSKKKAFVKAVNCWKNIDNVSYYFNKSGISTKMFKSASGKLYLLKNKKMTAAPGGIYRMSNNRYYYFNSKGKRVTKSCWKKLDSTSKVFISTKGDVTYKYKIKSGKCYKYNVSTRKWVAIKNKWLKISGKYYYFGANGKMQKNTIAGSKSKGWYYVDKTGARVTSKEIKLAVKFVTDNTETGWSKEKKLKACYDCLWKNYKYKRYYETPKASDMPEYAYQMFKNKRGNCYRYASAFAYTATVLGYDARVACGKIASIYGGMTPHGWTEVCVNGKWLICDPDMQMNYPNINSYMRTTREYPYPLSTSVRYGISITNGRINWKSVR